jgi:hypothetical protein
VSHAPGVGNPVFDGEDAYEAALEPDAGHRLLGLFRFWNMIRYWFPYRDLIDEDWGAVLREFVPRVMADDDPEAYALTMLELAGRTQDTHANVPRAAALRPPRGPAQLPVVVRFIEGQAVVTGYAHAELGPGSELRPGDVITHLDGAPVDSLVGSTTAGADGNISRIPLPGGIEAIITGIGVFYPDRSPTQRIGIIQDLEVRLTIQGIRDGRDEVLDAGVSHALGREFRLRR